MSVMCGVCVGGAHACAIAEAAYPTGCASPTHTHTPDTHAAQHTPAHSRKDIADDGKKLPKAKGRAAEAQ